MGSCATQHWTQRRVIENLHSMEVKKGFAGLKWRKLYSNFLVAAPRAQLHQVMPVFPCHPGVWKQEMLQQVAEIKHYDFVAEIEL